MAKEIPVEHAVNIVNKGTKISGDIIADNGIRIDGQLIGKLETKGKLVLGPTGYIKGDLVCSNVEVAGKIDGNINATELVSLKASARTKGKIVTRQLAIEPGAVFTGSCIMDDQIEAKKEK